MKTYLDYLDKMSKEELKEQIETNRKRKLYNNVFFGAVTGVSIIECPPAAIVSLSIGLVKIYWIKQNDKKIEEELNKRSYTLIKK